MAKLINLIPKNQRPIKENLEDMETVTLPAQMERFLDKTIAIIKGYNLPRKKEQLVIAKILDALKLNPSELTQAVQKLKKYGVVTRKKTGNDEHDWMGEDMNVDDEMTKSVASGLASSSKNETLKEATYVKGSGSGVKDLNYTLTNLQSVYKINRQDMEALAEVINALIK
jgi:hypothetical protein